MKNSIVLFSLLAVSTSAFAYVGSSQDPVYRYHGYMDDFNRIEQANRMHYYEVTPNQYGQGYSVYGY